MRNLGNKVQLIGNMLIGKVGNDSEMKILDLLRFSLATNENYKNAQGEKVQSTGLQNMVAWNKTAEIIEKYPGKGKEIAAEGKLTSRNYETKEGQKRYITEVIIREVLLLGAKNENKAG